MLALFSGLLVGFSLGLTGSGGSIFAVPLLVNLLALPLRQAVTISLVVVGITSLYGAWLQRSNVRWLASVVFGVGGVLGAPVGATIGAKASDSVLLVLFAALMILVAINMLSGFDAAKQNFILACRTPLTTNHKPTIGCALKLLLAGILTGILSGIFGIGGGFLIVPALLLVTAMPVQQAMATSLCAIFLISLSGFLSNLYYISAFPQKPAALFLIGATIGMSGGVFFKKRTKEATLRLLFAALVIAVALWTAGRALMAQE